MSQGIKVTLPGYNVLTETDARNFVFNSDYNHLKTAGFGTVLGTVTRFTKATGTVTHNLGYYPLVIAYWQDTANPGVWYPTATVPSDGGVIGAGRMFNAFNVSLRTDTTNLYIDTIHTSSSGTSPATGTIETRYEYFYEGS